MGDKEMTSAYIGVIIVLGAAAAWSAAWVGILLRNAENIIKYVCIYLPTSLYDRSFYFIPGLTSLPTNHQPPSLSFYLPGRRSLAQLAPQC